MTDKPTPFVLVCCSGCGEYYKRYEAPFLDVLNPDSLCVSCSIPGDLATEETDDDRFGS